MKIKMPLKLPYQPAMKRERERRKSSKIKIFTQRRLCDLITIPLSHLTQSRGMGVGALRKF